MKDGEPCSESSKPTWRREIGWWFVYLTIALYASWPLAWGLGSTISLGFEAETTVPVLNVWTLWWNSDRLAAGFQDYWNAPIFYPTKGAFAFSEAQPPMTIVAPIAWLTGSRVLAYNIYLLLILSLNGLACRHLLRRMGYRPWVIFCGSVMCQMLPFIWWQSGVVQLTTLFGMLWTLHTLWDLFDPQGQARRPATWEDVVAALQTVGLFRSVSLDTESFPVVNAGPGLRWDSIIRGLKLGGAFCLTYLLCNYWGMFLVLILVPSSLWLLNARLFRWAFWFELSVAVFLIAIILGPYVHVQKSLAKEHAWTRDLDWIRQLSAHTRDYLDTPQTASVQRPQIPLPGETAVAIPLAKVPWSLAPQLEFPEEDRKDVWPLGGGTIKLMLAPLGLLATLLTCRRRRWGLFVATVGVVAFGLSLGPTTQFAPWVPKIGGIIPYEILQKLVPGFSLIRSPFRFSLFVQLAAVWLSLEVLDFLHPGRWHGWVKKPGYSAPVGVEVQDIHPALRNPPSSPMRATTKWLAYALMVSLGIVLMFEVWPPRQSLYQCPSEWDAPSWVMWLRENSQSDDAVVCLPFPVGYTVGDYQGTAMWMYWGMLHRRPIVNGYSGFFPKHFVDLKEKLQHEGLSHAEGQAPPTEPQLKNCPADSGGVKDLNDCGARFVVVKRSFATRDEVWQHPRTKFRWAWVTADDTHEIDIYEIQPE